MANSEASSAEVSAPQSYKKNVQEILRRVQKRVDEGIPGIHAATLLSELMDRMILDLIESALKNHSEELTKLFTKEASIVAIGGYGQGKLCPQSDIDLLFLVGKNIPEEFEEVVSEIVREIWDAGLKLGHSVRTIPESITYAKTEPHVATSLVETRRLWGSKSLLKRLRKQYVKQIITTRERGFIDDCIESREQERIEHGSTVLSLEPDVKRALGGLRDIQLIRWIGFAHFGVADTTSIRRIGGFTKSDARMLREANNFLLGIRFNLHFHAGRPQDILNRQEQLRITEEKGIEKTEGQRPVERFMQTYFRHTAFVADMANRFAELARPESWASKTNSFLWTRKIERRFIIRYSTIDALPSNRKMISSDLASTMRLFELASKYNVSPSARFLEALQENLPEVSEAPLKKIVINRFFAILANTGHVGRILRIMHQCGVLERIIPESAFMRGLLQFNQYHHYTVDEHTFRAIEAAEKFENDPGIFGQTFAKIKRKEILFLALLLHDMGKGRAEDHSIVGERIAQKTAQRFQLEKHLEEQIAFLVRKHLRMSHLAFARDISDPSVILEFSNEVGNPATLRKLYLLTCADVKAVGPDAWTDWKGELLQELFTGSMETLSGSVPQEKVDNIIASLKEELQQSSMWAALTESQKEESETILSEMPNHYFMATTAEQIADDIKKVISISDDQPAVDSIYNAETGTVEFRLIIKETKNVRFFHIVAGILTARRMEVLGAEINTSSSGVIINRFYVVDPDLMDGDITRQIESTGKEIQKRILKPLSVEKLFKSNRRFELKSNQEPISGLPTRVIVDNETSETHTVIDVFANDRPGLLYVIANTFFELDISIDMAKISTYFDQSLDVFYVTDLQGRKITNDDMLEAIKDCMVRRIDEFERHGHKLFG